MLPPPITSPDQLPAELRKAVATLSVPNPAAPGGATQVWLLGVSHVSRVASDQVRSSFLLRTLKRNLCMRPYRQWQCLCLSLGHAG